MVGHIVAAKSALPSEMGILWPMDRKPLIVSEPILPPRAMARFERKGASLYFAIVRAVYIPMRGCENTLNTISTLRLGPLALYSMHQGRCTQRSWTKHSRCRTYRA